MCNNYQSKFEKQLCCSSQLYIIDHCNDNAKETLIRGLWGQERSEKTSHLNLYTHVGAGRYDRVLKKGLSNMKTDYSRRKSQGGWR